MVLDNKKLLIMNYFVIDSIFHLLMFKFHKVDIDKLKIFHFVQLNLVIHIINEINDYIAFRLFSFYLAYVLTNYKLSKLHF